jgi:aldose 1-epimerase
MITLTSEHLTVALDPEAGGIVVSADWHDASGDKFAMLHAPADRPTGKDHRPWYGTWPLVPFANRAFGAKLRVGDEVLQLDTNDGSHNLHGYGWSSPWSVGESRPDGVTLTHIKRDGDAYRYHCEQEITLEADGALKLHLRIRNDASRALPFGLGHHPWFPLDNDTTLLAPATGEVMLGRDYRPESHRPVPPDQHWNKARVIEQGKEVVSQFTGWSGRAVLDYPSRGHAIEITASESLSCPLLWTPGNAAFVCFEPQSHVLGAPGEDTAIAAGPLKMLEPGERLTGWMRLRVLQHEVVLNS